MRETLIQEAAAAFVAIEAARAEPRRLRAEAAQMRRQRDADDAERARIREEEEADEARRLIDGPDAVPEKPRRRKRGEELDARAPAKTAAITILGDRAAAAEAAIDPLKIPFAAASLRLVADVQGDPIAEMREALGRLAPAAARLLAGDHVLAATVGTSGFPVPAGAPLPVKGSLLVERLIKGIPDALLPAALKAEDLAAAARAISQPIIAKVKGISND